MVEGRLAEMLKVVGAAEKVVAVICEVTCAGWRGGEDIGSGGGCRLDW